MDIVADATSTERIPWWTPQLGEREKALVCQVIDSGFPNDGPVTRQLEELVADFCGVPYAVCTTSGTAAIFLSLVALGVEPGDEVIIPDITFIATANAVVLAGAKPVLVDVDPETACLDPRRVAEAITGRTRAIMPVHVSGRAADLSALQAIADKHGLAIVEDATEAMGSRHNQVALGGIGDAGCFSLTASKMITTGQGGVVITRNAAVHQRVRELKDQGRTSRGTGFADLHPSIGYNFKYTDLQAAVGIAQLERLPGRLERLREIYEIYRSELAGSNGIRLLPFDIEGGERPLWVDAEIEDREALVQRLSGLGIETRPFWFPLHTQEPYKRADGDFPVSTALAARSLWLPSAFTLSDEQIRRACDEVRRHLAERWS